MARNRKALQLLREFSAEFAGTALMLSIGISSCCMDKFNGSASGGITVVVGWGLAVLFGVTISGGISGGHLNPAVSFAFALSGDLPWLKFFVYCVAQILGAFIGSSIAFGIYFDAFNSFDGGFRTVEGYNSTAGLFSTYPQEFVTSSGAFANEVFATAILLMLVMAIVDTENMQIPFYLMPSMVGLVVVLVNCSLCYNSGCAINPARDLGPRIFTFVAGWGVKVFSYRNWNWFWVPLAGPMVGGPLGVLAYKILISFQISAAKKITNSVEINFCQECKKQTPVDSHSVSKFSHESKSVRAVEN